MSLRTVQRIEAEGNGSSESRLAIAAALKVDASVLSEPDSRKPAREWRWGTALGFACATAAVAYAWVAVSHTAPPATVGVFYGLFGATYGAICAAAAIYVQRQRTKEAA